MDPKKIQLFDMVRKKMTYLGQRQDVLAQNIANANSPDYVARDLVPLDFKRTLNQQFHRLAPAKTTSGHINGSLPLEPKFRTPEIRKAYETSPDGNKVVLEQEMVKMTETKIEHQTAANIYKKYQKMMKMSLGRN